MTNKEKSELFEKLQAVDKKYRTDPYGTDLGQPKDLGLEKLSISEVTDEQLQAQAKAKAEQKIRDELMEAIEKINGKEAKASAQRDSLESAAEKTKAELISAYDAHKEDASNQANLRGLARSSIIMNQLEGYDNKKLNAIADIDKTVSSEVAQLDSTIKALTNERESAKAYANTTLDAQMEELLNGLKAERDKRVEEVLKYNNQVTEKESEYQAQRAKDNYNATQDAIRNRNDKELQEKVNLEKSNIAEKYFLSMAPQIALDELLSDPTYRDLLGGIAYARILGVIRQKL